MIDALYDALMQTAPTPVVELNRAVAVSMAYGPEAALPIVDTLALKSYHWLPTVRADCFSTREVAIAAQGPSTWLRICCA